MCFIAGAPIASLLRIYKILVHVPVCHWLGDPRTTLHVCGVTEPETDSVRIHCYYELNVRVGGVGPPGASQRFGIRSRRG